MMWEKYTLPYPKKMMKLSLSFSESPECLSSVEEEGSPAGTNNTNSHVLLFTPAGKRN